MNQKLGYDIEINRHQHRLDDLAFFYRAHRRVLYSGPARSADPDSASLCTQSYQAPFPPTRSSAFSSLELFLTLQPLTTTIFSLLTPIPSSIFIWPLHSAARMLARTTLRSACLANNARGAMRRTTTVPSPPRSGGPEYIADDMIL